MNNIEGNKIIVDSKYFLSILCDINKPLLHSVRVLASKENHTLQIGGLRFDCECSNSFDIMLYNKSIDNLISILKIVSQQPITLKFKDSELFNVEINSMAV